MLQLGVVRCTTVQHAYRGITTRRVTRVQMGPGDAVAPPLRPRAAPLPPRARRCANGHHQRKHRRGREGVGDRPGDGEVTVRSDRRLEHRSGDKHDEPVQPGGNRKAHLQRRHQQVECCESRNNGHGMRVCVCVSDCVRVRVRVCVHVFVCVRERVYLARHPSVRYIEIHTW